MAKEVSPELLEKLKTYLEKRERSEVSLLSFYYKYVFNKELNVKCGGCIEDAVSYLKRILNNKQKTIFMGNFKWIGGNKSALLRQAGQVISINAKNFSDAYGELLYQIPKYSHLVEFLGGEKVGKSEIGIAGDLVGIISTDIQTVSEDEIVKKKRGRPKLQ